MATRLSERASGASEAFSLVMKNNNCLRIRVLTRNACLHLAYVSFGVHVLTCCTCPQLANMSSPSTSPSPSWVYGKNYHPVFQTIKSLDGDRGVDRCHYAVPFKGISITSTPVFHLNETNNYKKAKMKGGLSWMTNYYR